MDTPWRERIPLPYAPRHPLWLDAYFAAWELLAQGAPKGPDSCLLALCLRYAGEGAAWLERCEPSASLAWCEWQCFQHSADAARLARVLPGLAERSEERTGLAAMAYEALAAECVAHSARALGDVALAARFEQAWRAGCQALNAQTWAKPAGF